MTIQEAREIALAHYRAGRLQEAERICLEILRVSPDSPDVLHRLGLIAYRQGQYERATAHIAQAVRLDGQRADYYNNLGELLRIQERASEAIACYRRAIELKPDCAEAYNNLGTVLAYQGSHGAAVGCFREAVRLNPGYAAAHNNLGVALGAAGSPDEAIACYRRALELMPGYAEAYDNILCALQYRAGVTLAELRDAHDEYERRYAAPLRAEWHPHQNSRDPDRPLRLGFVSPDLWRHPVAFFLIRALENLDRHTCRVTCYSDRVVPNDLTARFQAASAAWRDSFAMSDPQLAEQIRADRIDILFDLTGHTRKNRLLVFARKPAPIQITWIGYEGTTGLKAMDYILADRYEIPPEAEPYYTERVLRMPEGYLCYDPPSHAPAVGPLPALTSDYATRAANTPGEPNTTSCSPCGRKVGGEGAAAFSGSLGTAGRLTFASFNNPAKITPQVVACWARILYRLPQARLILKYRGMDDRGAQGRLRGLFDAQGVSAGRVEFLGWSPHAETLALYNQVDIALDPFPFTGGATTCDALWMGVPVVTCPGETFASRHGLSHLSNVGLAELIARDVGQYVDLAVGLAEDLPRLAALRAGLRQRMARSPLCDGKRFAGDFMEIVRRVWREWTGRIDNHEQVADS